MTARPLALVLLAALAAPPARAQDKAAPADEEVVAVQKGVLTPTLELDVTFESIETVEIKPRMETYQGEMTIVRVAAQGQYVRKGEPVLALDRTPIERLIANTEIDLRVARAALEKAETDVRLGEKADALALLQAETAVRDAEATLRAYEEVEGKHLVQQAELAVRYGEDGIKDQQEELDQLEKMYKTEQLTNATAEIVVRRTRRALERSRTQLEMLRGEHKLAKDVKYPQQRQAHAFGLENARRALDALKPQQALARVQREAELAKTRAAASQQEDLLAKLRRDLENFTMKAPFDGRVYYGQLVRGAWTTADQVAPFLHPGEKLQPGMVFLTVCGVRTRAVADLPEPDYFDVAIDQSATVAPASVPEAKREGVVRAKSVVTQTKGNATAFDLTIEMKEPPADLLPGMKGKATIKGQELRDVVLVPNGALSSNGGKLTVKVAGAGKEQAREVTVGKTDGKMTQVRTGLEAGEKVCVPK